MERMEGMEGMETIARWRVQVHRVISVVDVSVRASSFPAFWKQNRP